MLDQVFGFIFKALFSNLNKKFKYRVNLKNFDDSVNLMWFWQIEFFPDRFFRIIRSWFCAVFFRTF